MTNKDRTTIRGGFGILILGVGNIIHLLDGGRLAYPYVIVGYIILFVGLFGWWLPKEDE